MHTIMVRHKKSWLFIGLVLLAVGIWLGMQRLATVEQKKVPDAALSVSRPISAESVAAAPSSDFFTEYRLEREKLRSEKTEILQQVLKQAATEEQKKQTQDALVRLLGEKQKEAELESLIKAKGFADALIFLRERSVSAVIKTGTLQREEVLQIAEIISRVAGVGMEDITISAKP